MLLIITVITTVIISLPLAILLVQSRKENVRLKYELERETERRRFLQSTDRGISWIPNPIEPFVTFWDSSTRIITAPLSLSQSNGSVELAEKMLIDNAIEHYSRHQQSIIEGLFQEGKL